MKSNCKHCNVEFTWFPSQQSGTFCSRQCSGAYYSNLNRKNRLRENTDFQKSTRKYVLEIKGEHCECCGISEWQGAKLTLQIDHINGNRRDNRIENLRVLCPNCHSQTPTFNSKNVSPDGKKRMLAGGKKGAIASGKNAANRWRSLRDSNPCDSRERTVS